MKEYTYVHGLKSWCEVLVIGSEHKRYDAPQLDERQINDEQNHGVHGVG